ncbi:PASTA domain-containing protein [Enterococcus sp. DIV0840c]|uniref:PASTA domain-containing protein n=1 Tax=Enterococcus sp. DIV0840c TaxID=2774772 RepID=UPI003D2714DD
MSDFLSKFDKKNEDSAIKGVSETDKFSNKTRKKMNHRENEEPLETDPFFKKKKRKKYIFRLLITLSLIAVSVLLFFQFAYIRIGNFVDKDISDVRKWATEHNLAIDVTPSYDKAPVNQVLSQQEKAGSRVRKKSMLHVTISQGPNPEEKLDLPDFMKISREEAVKWIEENQAVNLTIVDEYHDEIKEQEPIRIEFTNKEVTKENYLRKDVGRIFFSKGKEVFEKNIDVPDFRGKALSEVETWVKANEIELEVKKEASDTIEEGKIINQSLSSEEKIAKREKFQVTLSLGKGVTVPNFSEVLPDNADSVAEGLSVRKRMQLTRNMPYGQLISQSIPAGTILTSEDEQAVDVVYSAGQPYIRDYRLGEYLEGDLQKLFFEEFRSKGANINYQVRYVNSSEPYGTIVGMSKFNQFLALEDTITFDISLGNKNPGPPDKE